MMTSSSMNKVCLCIVASVFLNNVQSSHQFAVNVHKQHSVSTENHVVIRNEKALTTPLPISTCGTLNGFKCYRFATGCYCVVTTQMNWTMAYNYCLNNGRSLLSIQTQAKQSDLQVNLPSIIGTNNIVTQVGVWTSGAYFPQLGQFFWSSQCQRKEAVVFSFTNWQLGEPNNQKSPFFDCVRLIPSISSVWADLDCKQYLPFICEF